MTHATGTRVRSDVRIAATFTKPWVAVGERAVGERDADPDAGEREARESEREAGLQQQERHRELDAPDHRPSRDRRDPVERPAAPSARSATPASRLAAAGSPAVSTPVMASPAGTFIGSTDSGRPYVSPRTTWNAPKTTWNAPKGTRTRGSDTAVVAPSATTRGRTVTESPSAPVIPPAENATRSRTASPAVVAIGSLHGVHRYDGSARSRSASRTRSGNWF